MRTIDWTAHAATQTRDELTVEVRALTRLHELSTRLLERTELPAILNEVLEATLGLQGADMGIVHLHGPDARPLHTATHHGFRADVLEQHGAALDELACRAALRARARFIVEDVLADPGLAPYVPVAEQAGFRALQSTPMISRTGESLGVLSTYFRQPYRPSEHDLRLTDLYARQATEAIERSRASEALRASEERFRRVFELGLVGMALASPNRACIEVNQELCRILGYSRDELIGKDWADLTHPDDLAADLEKYEETLAGRLEGYSLETRLIRKTGEAIHTSISASCVRRADGSVDYFVGLVQDITRRKHAEEELRRAAADLAEAQRLSHTGSWSWRLATDERVWSEELYRIYGLTPGDDLARAARRQTHPDDERRVIQAVAGALRDRQPFDLQYRICLADSSIKHVRLLGRPSDKDESALQYNGVVMDVTEAKRAEAAVEEAQSELARITRLIAIGEVAATIAHEINQPLGAIVNNANVCLQLLDADPPPDDAREVMRDIAQDAQRASDIIHNIRTLTRTASLQRTWFSPGDLVADVLRLAQRQLADTRTVIHTPQSNGLPHMFADRVQMQRLLLNLVLNAIEAMSAVEDNRRVLTIDVRRDTLDGVSALALTVQDVGTGFDPKDTERLFEPFHTTKRKGMGMGLRIARSIVEAHGGRLLATSSPGAGATFRCLLPLEPGLESS